MNTDVHVNDFETNCEILHNDNNIYDDSNINTYKKSNKILKPPKEIRMMTENNDTRDIEIGIEKVDIPPPSSNSPMLSKKNDCNSSIIHDYLIFRNQCYDFVVELLSTRHQ
jgi:hypothetical protein